MPRSPPFVYTKQLMDFLSRLQGVFTEKQTSVLSHVKTWCIIPVKIVLTGGDKDRDRKRRNRETEKREKGRYTGPLLCARRSPGDRRLHRRFLFSEQESKGDRRRSDPFCRGIFYGRKC